MTSEARCRVRRSTRATGSPPGLSHAIRFAPGTRFEGAWTRAEETRSIASKIAAFSLVLVLGLAALGVHSELQFREFSQGLDAHIATYKRQRWERPVLRGAAGEGNAHAVIAQALHGRLIDVGMSTDLLL